MVCRVCGSSKTAVGAATSDIICGSCGLPLHVDGKYFNYYHYDSF